MKRKFEVRKENLNKYISIEVQNNKLIVITGDIETSGVTEVKEYIDIKTAKYEAERLIEETTNQSYELVSVETDSKFGEDDFWGLIDKSKKKTKDSSERAEILTEILAKRSEGDIIEFGKIFQKLYAESYQSGLWAAAYIINGGCSDDGFDYFRGWLIGQGKDAYYNALENPESLTKIIKVDDAGEIECEEMLSVATDAYNLKTDEEYDNTYDLIPYVSFPKIELDWSEDGDDLKKKFPKLYKKFMD
jgi:predicted DNA-binding WGR domain protein